LEEPSPSKRRTWVRVNDKIDAKAMKSVNVNEDEAASQINLEAEMEQIKQEILSEMRQEMNKLKQDILEGTFCIYSYY
jgi:hypothetical protein